MRIKLGMVGVGTIAACVIKGLLQKNDKDLDICLSPRGAAKVAELTRLFPSVRAMPSNQAVLDHADWILLAVRPQEAEEAIKALRFSGGHKVLSVIAMTPIERLRALIPEADTFVRMIPLPFIERRGGPIVLYPDNGEILSLFADMGRPVVPHSEPMLDVLSAVTGSMSPFYRVTGQVTGWGVRHGLSAETAAAYVVAFYQALLETCAQTPPEGIGDLWREMTPGGLNACATAAIEAGGGFDIWDAALDEAMARIRRQSRG